MNKETKENLYVALGLAAFLGVLVLVGVWGYHHDKAQRIEDDKRYEQIVTDAMKQSSAGLDEAIDQAIAAHKKLRTDYTDLLRDATTWHLMTITHNKTGEQSIFDVQMALYKSVTLTGSAFTIYLDSAPYKHKSKKKP